jgi:predicted small lipoprotein YifL
VRRIGFAAALLLICFPLFAGCGKKGPPTLPSRKPAAVVKDLAGRWDGGSVVLTGGLAGVPAGKSRDLVHGARVCYGAYDPSDPPCETCPVRYHDCLDFGPEVVEGGEFRCRVPGMSRENLYFFQVRLLGPEGGPGPPSNRARVSSGDD